MNKLIVASITSFCACMVLSGCSLNLPFVTQTEKQQSTSSAQPTQIGVSEDSLDFTIDSSVPDFSEDSSEVDESTGSEIGTGNTLYSIVGEYAYALDPETLQPVGDPLDPVTHEPVQEFSSLDPTVQPENEPVPESSIEIETPTEVNKYPNTGIFLEDD